MITFGSSIRRRAPPVNPSMPFAEEQALYRALRDGAIGGAALDTWWRYPSADEGDGN